MQQTKQIGDIAVSAVTTEFLKVGLHVLFPFGDNLRFDIVVTNGTKFWRIQCKNGFLKKGVIQFRTENNGYKGKRKPYIGEIDHFGVYCPALNKCYLLPVAMDGYGAMTLRVDPPKNGQIKGIKFAKDFELSPLAQRLECLADNQEVEGSIPSRTIQVI